jgi:hypothetical protein
MILRLSSKEMDLQRSKQMHAASKCLPSSSVSPIIRGAYSATAARPPPTSWEPTIPSAPTSSNMTRHFIPNSRLQRPDGPIAPPTFWTVSGSPRCRGACTRYQAARYVLAAARIRA